MSKSDIKCCFTGTFIGGRGLSMGIATLPPSTIPILNPPKPLISSSPKKQYAMKQSTRIGQLTPEIADDYQYYRPYYPHLEAEPKYYLTLEIATTQSPVIAAAKAHGELIYKQYEHCSSDSPGQSDCGELKVTAHLVPMHIFERFRADWYDSGKRNAQEEIVRIFPKTWTETDLEEGDSARTRVWHDEEFLEALRRNESMEEAKPIIVAAVFKYACERLRQEAERQILNLDHDSELFSCLKEDCLREWAPRNSEPLTEDITLGSLATLSSPSPATWWRFHAFFDWANGLAVTTVFSTDPMPEGYTYVPFTNWFIDRETSARTVHDWCVVFDSETDNWAGHYESTGSYKERENLPKKQYQIVKDLETRVYLGARVPRHIYEEVQHEFEASGIRELGNLILEFFPKSATTENMDHRTFEDCWREISGTQWRLRWYHFDDGRPKPVPGDSPSSLENFIAAEGPKGLSARDTVILAVYSWLLSTIYWYYYQYELIKPDLTGYVTEAEEMMMEWGFTGEMPSLAELRTARGLCRDPDFFSTDIEDQIVKDKEDEGKVHILYIEEGPLPCPE
ncbi:hypothetical protein GGR57DRAFT_298560 [Xylariaceae sp. FL1272]|nr:hypothetical protein GGR57DRAFT_298560 [Xylariaceae sp. FL1272]